MKERSATELSNSDNAIDAFQLSCYTLSLGDYERDVLTEEAFYKALAYFLRKEYGEVLANYFVDDEFRDTLKTIIDNTEDGEWLTLTKSK